jgi:adenylylsulfate kinase-like enzyme
VNLSKLMPPENAELRIDTAALSVEQAAAAVVRKLAEMGMIGPAA